MLCWSRLCEASGHLGLLRKPLDDAVQPLVHAAQLAKAALAVATAASALASASASALPRFVQNVTMAVHQTVTMANASRSVTPLENTKRPGTRAGGRPARMPGVKHQGKDTSLSAVCRFLYQARTACHEHKGPVDIRLDR